MGQALAQVKDQVQTLTTPEIVLFTLIYTSPEAFNALARDSNFDEKLDFILSKHVDQMTPEEFGGVCNSIVGRAGLSFNDGNLYATFVKEAIPSVQSWLAHNQLPLNNLPSVVAALNIVMDELDAEKRAALVGEVEGCIFENSRKIAVDEAVELVRSVSNYASAEVIELLDRIIGNGIYDLKPDQIIPTLEAFLSSEHSRDKIFQALIKRVRDDVDHFTLSELTTLSVILRAFEDRYEGVYQLIEPYIVDKLGSLTEGDLVNAIQGFYNPKLSRRYEILDILEESVVAQIDTLNFETVKHLNEFYETYKIGNKTLIGAIKGRLESGSNASAASTPLSQA